MAGAHLNPVYGKKWLTSRAKVGLDGEDFDRRWAAGESFVCDFPWWDYTAEIHQDGTRVFQTRDVFPDLPAILIYYRVEGSDCIFLSVSEDWGEDELAPEGFD